MNQVIDVKHNHSANKGMFFAGEGENILAEMTYSMPANDKMIIEHTEVSDDLRGKNIGLQLVQASVEYAKINNIKIIPLCPFARSVFRKKKEFQDVLYV